MQLVHVIFVKETEGRQLEASLSAPFVIEREIAPPLPEETNPVNVLWLNRMNPSVVDGVN